MVKHHKNDGSDNPANGAGANRNAIWPKPEGCGC